MTRVDVAAPESKLKRPFPLQIDLTAIGRLPKP